MGGCNVQLSVWYVVLCVRYGTTTKWYTPKFAERYKFLAHKSQSLSSTVSLYCTIPLHEFVHDRLLSSVFNITQYLSIFKQSTEDEGKGEITFGLYQLRLPLTS